MKQLTILIALPFALAACTAQEGDPAPAAEAVPIHQSYSDTADQYEVDGFVVSNVDERKDLGIDSANGVALAANWTFDDRWMPFARLGFSKGSTPIYNESVTLGLIHKFLYRSDLVGIAANHGSPPDNTLRDQTSVEAFWRFQFSENLAITPSLQLLIDPALNPVDDKVWVFGARFRITF
jgi:porin